MALLERPKLLKGSEKRYPLLERPTPFLDFLKGRPTLILEKPLVEKLGIDPPELPPGVTREEAKEVIKAAWGVKLATGIAERARLTGRAKDRFIEEWSDVVSEGLLRGIV